MITFNSMPDNACDCHVHVVGPITAYPMIAARQYTPGPAPLQNLKTHLSAVGLGRAVIVQPSFYGTDNRFMLDCLKQMAGAGRGIAVVDEAISDEELLALHEGGVRGLRLNVESSPGLHVEGGPHPLERALEFWADRLARIAHLGWHVQVFAAIDLIVHCAPLIRTLPYDLVLDHFAMVPSPLRVEDPTLAALIALLESGKIWVKLSAPYRPPVAGVRREEDFIQLAQRLINTNPQRIVWGSDWPHTQRQAGKSPLETSAYREIASATLSEQIHHWMPSEALLRQVMVMNPAKLYDF
jgi:2-pyrone-4,6-dicarboxylate lactonase